MARKSPKLAVQLGLQPNPLAPRVNSSSPQRLQKGRAIPLKGGGAGGLFSRRGKRPKPCLYRFLSDAIEGVCVGAGLAQQVRGGVCYEVGSEGIVLVGPGSRISCFVPVTFQHCRHGCRLTETRRKLGRVCRSTRVQHVCWCGKTDFQL